MPVNTQRAPPADMKDDEIDARFQQVLLAMDLPVEKAKALRAYSRDKKWDLICDQKLTRPPDPPAFYLDRLRAQLATKASRSFKPKKLIKSVTSRTSFFHTKTTAAENYPAGSVESSQSCYSPPMFSSFASAAGLNNNNNNSSSFSSASSTHALRELEISLRTNTIDWVRDFLNNSTNRGLDVLVEFLAYRLAFVYFFDDGCGTAQNNDDERRRRQRAITFDGSNNTLNSKACPVPATNNSSSSSSPSSGSASSSAGGVHHRLNTASAGDNLHATATAASKPATGPPRGSSIGRNSNTSLSLCATTSSGHSTAASLTSGHDSPQHHHLNNGHSQQQTAAPTFHHHRPAKWANGALQTITSDAASSVGTAASSSASSSTNNNNNSNVPNGGVAAHATTHTNNTSSTVMTAAHAHSAQNLIVTAMADANLFVSCTSAPLSSTSSSSTSASVSNNNTIAASGGLSTSYLTSKLRQMVVAASNSLTTMPNLQHQQQNVMMKTAPCGNSSQFYAETNMQNNKSSAAGVGSKKRARMQTALDDIHVCIMCFRAIMNNKYGFNMVISHREAINLIALSLVHRNLRTKALVLELLAAICLVRGGHAQILAAFDNCLLIYRQSAHFVYGSTLLYNAGNSSNNNIMQDDSSSMLGCLPRQRFEVLMHYFKHYGPEFNVDFMVACMQFVNIVVHSVEDMNFRVFLQYEFTMLGLDDYLDKLKYTESEELLIQIQAYMDNVFDIGALMEEVEQKAELVERNVEILDELSRTTERLKQIENDALARVCTLENDLEKVQRDRNTLREKYAHNDAELTALRRAVSQRDAEARKQKEMLDTTMAQVAQLRLRFDQPHAISNNNKPNITTPGPAPPPPPPPPPSSSMLPLQRSVTPVPPPPPPLPSSSSSLMFSSFTSSKFQPPPAAPMMPGKMALIPSSLPACLQQNASSSLQQSNNVPPFMTTMTIKRQIPTKYKLPVLNWVALKPNQVNGTVFAELDDEKIIASFDFSEFEERFKTQRQPLSHNNKNAASAKDESTNVFRDGANAAAAAAAAASSSSHANNSAEQLANNRTRAKSFEQRETMLEMNRLRNTAILLRNIEMPVDELVSAINGLDTDILNQDAVDILVRMMPNEAEIKKYREYRVAGKPVDALTIEDQFLLRLTTTCERLQAKLQIMNLMHTFEECLHVLTPQVQAVATASRAVRKSERFRRLLEMILAFGNYLNSSRRGPAYGFKLSSLESLLDLKATEDKSYTLMHYLARASDRKIDENNSSVDFEADFGFSLHKACEVSLENVLTDVNELNGAFKQARHEYKNRVASELPHLRQFLETFEPKFTKLLSETGTAQDEFRIVVEYFGEQQIQPPPQPPTSTATGGAAAATPAASQRTMIQPSSFFSNIRRFARAFDAARKENLAQEQKQQAAAAQKPLIAQTKKQRGNKAAADSNNNAAIISELKSRSAKKRLQHLHLQQQQQPSSAAAASAVAAYQRQNSNNNNNNTQPQLSALLTPNAAAAAAAAAGAAGVVDGADLHINREDIEHGTLEDILTGLKTEPYRRGINDSSRRSFRGTPNSSAMATSQSMMMPIISPLNQHHHHAMANGGGAAHLRQNGATPSSRAKRASVALTSSIIADGHATNGGYYGRQDSCSSVSSEQSKMQHQQQLHYHVTNI